jgi:hypothetical protein
MAPTQKMMATGITTCMTLLVLLACGVADSMSSLQVAAATSVIDGAGKVENDSKKDKSALDLANAQVDWLISKGGSFDREKVVVRPVGSGDDNMEDESAKTKSFGLGIFAADDIKEGDLIMKIPLTTIMTKGT